MIPKYKTKIEQKMSHIQITFYLLRSVVQIEIYFMSLTGCTHFQRRCMGQTNIYAKEIKTNDKILK